MTIRELIRILNESKGESTMVYHSGYNDNGEEEDFMFYHGKLIKL